MSVYGGVYTGGKFAASVVDTGRWHFATCINNTAKLVAKFAAGVVDTGGKFASGVVGTGGKFATGVVDAPWLANTRIFKKIQNGPNGAGGGGGSVSWKKTEAKNLVKLSL